MGEPIKAIAGRWLRRGSRVASLGICLWGLYVVTHADVPLDFNAAIFSVATVGMACWVTWSLGNMAQQLCDGRFVPNFSLRSSSKKDPDKPDD